MNNKDLLKYGIDIAKIEKEHDIEVVYLTLSGSKLYGTNTPTSDTDIKGIFIPSKRSLILKKDPGSITLDTNKTNIKNTSKDVDCTIHNIYNFFNQLKKSETGAVDILFSMWSNDTIVYANEKFLKVMKENYKIFLNRNMKSFIGYALGQTKKFGIKGRRYDELDDFIKKFYVWSDKYLEQKLDDGRGSWENLKGWVNAGNYKYIEFLMAPGPKTSGAQKDIEYIAVLGKMFPRTVKIGYMYERISKLYEQFGNRTKTIAATVSKTDFKALSHSLRIALEVKELLETGFIKFPLKDAKKLREIKEGKYDFEEIVNEVEKTLTLVDEMLLTSEFPKNADSKKIEKLYLDFVDPILI